MDTTNKQKFINLIKDQYNELLDGMDLNNTILKDNIKRQLKLRVEWESYKAACDKILSDIDVDIDNRYSMLFKEIKENSKLDLSTADIKIYINSDEAYIALRKERNGIKNIMVLIESAIKTIDDYKWSLKNLTDLVIAGSENYIL